MLKTPTSFHSLNELMVNHGANVIIDGGWPVCDVWDFGMNWFYPV